MFIVANFLPLHIYITFLGSRANSQSFLIICIRTCCPCLRCRKRGEEKIKETKEILFYFIRT